MSAITRRAVVRLGVVAGGAAVFGPGLSRLLTTGTAPVPAAAAPGTMAVVDGVPAMLAVGGLGVGHVGDGILVADDAASSGRACTISASTDLVTCTGHGLQDGDPVVFGTLAGGDPLKTDKTYYVRDRTANSFGVASSPGGARVDVTTGSTGACRLRSQAEMGRKRLVIEQACDAVELVFANFTCRAGSANDAAPANPIGVKAALELIPGESTAAATAETFPAFFEDGAREATIPPGETRVARVAHPVPQAGAVFVRYRVTVAEPSGRWPRYQMIATDTSEGERAVEGGSRLGDRVDETGWQGGDGTPVGSRMYAPLLVRARTAGEASRRRAALVLGDSIASPKDSWVVRGLHAAGLGYLNLARPAEASHQFLPSGAGNGPREVAAMRRELLAAEFAFSDVIIQYGRNQGGFTATQIRSQIQGLVEWLLDTVEAVPRVHLCTVTPKSKSTDGFTTTGGQTPDASNAVIQEHNRWVRGKPSFATNIIDVAALAEDGTTGRWLAPGGAALTNDGTHPTQAGRARLAGAITPAMFPVL